MRRLLLALSLSLGCLHAQENWQSMPGIQQTPASWRAHGVSLAAEGEQLVIAHGTNANGFALPRAARFRRELSVEAVVTMRKRLLGKSGWNFAGVTLFQDGANFWMLGLVEGPEAKHSIDFIECHAGTWQAQSAAGKALKGEGSASYGWQAGTAYHLRLAFHGGKVHATVSDASAKKQLTHATYDLAKGPAVRAGMPGLIIRGSEAAFANLQAQSPTQAANTPPGVKIMDGKLGRVAFFDEPLKGTDLQANQRLTSALQSSGFGVTRLSAGQITQPGLLSTSHFHILVVPNCASLPVAAGDAVLQFAREGGHLIFIGGPFLDNPTWQVGGEWLDSAGLAKLKQALTTAHHPFGITPDLDLSGWRRNCKNPETKASLRVPKEGPGGTTCIRLDFAQFEGWDGFLSRDLPRLFGEGHDLLTFVGKGDARTSQLAIEIQEKDGSRWIATAELTTDWQRLGLAIQDFHYWPDSPTKKTRGQATDHLIPSQAARINLGLASTHTPAVGGGAHTIWVADLGSAKNPVDGEVGGSPQLSGTIPTIFPRYKVHPLAGPVKARRTLLLQPPLDSLRKLPPQRQVTCGIPRTLGTGFDRDHKWRFVPLAVASQTADSPTSGICEWLVLNQDIPLDGVAIAAFGYNDPETWRSPAFLNRVSATAKLLRQGAMLEEAGTEHFAYWPGEKVRLGVRLRSFAQTASKGDVKIVVRDGARTVWQAQSSPSLPPGHSELEFVWEPPPKPAVYTFEVTFGGAADSPVSDSIKHEFAVLDPAPAPKSEFVTVHDGDFWLKGEKWYPVGINYWPLYVAGMDRGDYWAGWMRDRYYEPTLVEQDLVQMADMGINMVSIQSPSVENCRNLLDFARRCAKHGIWINLYNGLASPLAFNDAGLKEFLETSRIPGNPVIFAYDTIWEPGNYVFKDDGTRGRWDGEWRAWLVERYGSVENAEKDWSYKARRNDQGQVISPPNKHFREDGEWRGMMAAYRRFMDDLTSRLWGKAHRRLRELDPNHLISYRQ
ncbi:MAG: hypothetical protein HN380_26525, partial [Victivallales bacterium]|nr:hypothetical protein [Victivallales bacterium]